MENRQRLRVLVVEDEYFIAYEMSYALQQGGIDVVGPYSSVEQALKAIEVGGFDIAVLDLNLDGNADFTVADELSRRDVPFVFATGYDANVIPSRHAEISLFEKPYDPGVLASHLMTVGGSSRVER